MTYQTQALHHDNAARLLANYYARYCDERNFEAIHTLLWPEFEMQAQAWQLQGAEAFIASLEQLRQFDRTFHLVANQTGHWLSDSHYEGETYCIASHFFRDEQGQEKNHEMGIRYKDIIEGRDDSNGDVEYRFLSRQFQLVWQDIRSITAPQ